VGDLADGVDHELQQRQPATEGQVVAEGDPAIRVVPVHRRMRAHERERERHAAERERERHQEALHERGSRQR